MSFFSVEGIKRRALFLTLAATVLIIAAIVLTGPLWAATLPPIPLVGVKPAVTNKQAPAATGKQAPQVANAAQQTDGKAWLGIVVNDADGGAKVLQVLPNSPADTAGVKKDDVVTAVNNVNVAKAQDVVNEVQKSKPGDKVVLAIKRGNDQMQIEVTAGTLPARSQLRGNQPFGFQSLPPELKGLEGVPLREMFSHFMSGTFTMKDQNGQEVVLNITPGTVASATATSLSINPNDGGAAKQFDVSADTALVGTGPRTKVENLSAGSQVLVVTIGDSTHASMVVRTNPAYSPMGQLFRNYSAPQLWQMPDIQRFRGWQRPPAKPTPGPNL